MPRYHLPTASELELIMLPKPVSKGPVLPERKSEDAPEPESKDFAEGDLIFDADSNAYRVRDGIAVGLLHENLRFALETDIQRGGFSYNPRPGTLGRRSDRTVFQVVNAEDRPEGFYLGRKGIFYHEFTPSGLALPATVKGPFKSTGEAYAAALDEASDDDAGSRLRAPAFG
jgi:uncharacterized protein YbaR (Trm112 family)